MKNILLVLSLISIPATAFAGAPTHCDPSEKIVYSCQIKGSSKIVSLCASKDLSAKSGYLQYRFGRPGKVELEFPERRQNSQKLFHYAHYFRFQIDRTEVSFKNKGYKYTLYEYYDGEETPPKSETGVRVNKTSLPCGSTPINNLVTLREAVPCDEENALGGCN